MQNRLKNLHIVLISGMSGSGKSVALRALEDLGFYCVDNLPPELLMSLILLDGTRNITRLAIAMDVRSAGALPLLPGQMEQLQSQGAHLDVLFLDATTDTLIRRFSETRRRHPLSGTGHSSVASDQHHALADAIGLERELLGDLRGRAHVIDTSILRATQLHSYIRAFLRASSDQLTLVFESFAFKRGIPHDADYVFDVRMLPNPHYEPALRALTGRDDPVIQFLQVQPDVTLMLEHIGGFLEHWLQALSRDHRSYVTVALGCTGGQHRSVYLTERLAAQFTHRWTTLTRHRELDGKSSG